MVSQKINFTNQVPRGTAKKLHKAIKKKVSLRQVQRIIAGTSEDSYGIIDMVIIEAAEYKKMLERQKKALQKLTSSTPNTK